jgi:hypothetical protein
MNLHGDRLPFGFGETWLRSAGVRICVRALDGESLTEGLGAGQGGERFHGGIAGVVARFLETYW